MASNPVSAGLDQQAACAGLAGEQGARKDLVSGRRHIGEIQARQPRLLIGARHGLGAQRNPFLEAAERLIADAVVVLDEIHATQGTGVGHVGQMLRRQPQRLDGGTKQRPIVDLDALPQTRDPKARPAIVRQQARRQFDAVHAKAREEAAGAPHEIEQLGQFRARCLHSEADRRQVAPITRLLESLQLAHDAVPDVAIGHEFSGKLHALLDARGLGQRPGLGFTAGNVILHPETLA